MWLLSQQGLSIQIIYHYMFRGKTAKLLRLLRNGSSPPLTTHNLTLFTNHIPCNETTFLTSDRATLYTLREMEEYPSASLTAPTHSSPSTSAPPIFESPKMEEIYHNAMGFSVDLNYLKIEEARKWFLALDEQERSSNAEALRQIKEWISATLLEESMDDYVKEEALRLIEEIGAVEGRPA